MHPDQFDILSSTNEKIIENSIRKRNIILKY